MTGSTTVAVSSVRLPSAGVLVPSGPAYYSTVDMLSAGSFAVFAGVAIVNTGPSRIVGDVGVYPGACISRTAPM